MKLIGDGDGDGVAGGGRKILVGIKLDHRSRELLTWSLVKVAEPGDFVIAVHVLDSITGLEGTASTQSLLNTFKSVFAVYNGFCTIKQVDITLKMCRGDSVRKSLVQEAKSLGVATVIVGTSKSHHLFRSPAKVAKYCAKKLPKCFSVFAVDSGKIAFHREATRISNRPGGDEQHATGEVVRRCGLCRESDMVLKKNRDGNFMVGCLGFPQCRNAVWLPGSVSEASVTTNTCNSCTPGPVYRIQLKFRQLEIPPNYNVNHLGCIGGCDEILRQLIEICGTGSRMAGSYEAKLLIVTGALNYSWIVHVKYWFGKFCG